MLREIVTIDEELCDGCGECVPSCHEGALRIVDGKARLVADRLCDGLGDCLGHCPQGAIQVEHREVDAYDEKAVRDHLAREKLPTAPAEKQPTATKRPSPCSLMSEGSRDGCPGSKLAQFSTGATGASSDPTGAKVLSRESDPASASASALTHWPVQLRLLSSTAPVFRGAHLLVAADCVPVAYAGFHSDLLQGRSVAIACPKLDDSQGYVEKLAEILRENSPKDITVALMEVPCCVGLLRMVLDARRLAGSNIPVHEVSVGVQGRIIERKRCDAC